MDDSGNSDDKLSEFRQILVATPGVLYVGEFRRFLSPVMDIFPDKKSILLYDFAANAEHENEIAWMKHALAAEGISSEFYFLCERIGKGPYWARVTLSDQYEWVEPLWTRSRGMYFMPVDVSYFLEVITVEGIARVYKKG